MHTSDRVHEVCAFCIASNCHDVPYCIQYNSYTMDGRLGAALAASSRGARHHAPPPPTRTPPCFALPPARGARTSGSAFCDASTSLAPRPPPLARPDSKRPLLPLLPQRNTHYAINLMASCVIANTQYAIRNPPHGRVRNTQYAIRNNTQSTARPAA